MIISKLRSLVPAATIILLPYTTALSAPLVINALKSSTYTGIYEQPITLRDGQWQGEPFSPGGASRPSAGLVDDFQLSGDLNGDGQPEQVVILWQNDGGSGTQSYLAVMSRNRDKLLNLSTSNIGDRVQLRAGRIHDNKIELDVIQAGPGDPACCPSQKATRSWSLVDNKLKEAPVKTTGKLSLSDLEGVEWQLTHISRNEKLPKNVVINMAIKGNKLTGKSACNRYFTEIKESAEIAGDISIKIGPTGSTMMACPDELMTLERRYLTALQNTNNFSFLAGKLVFNWHKEDKADAMYFMPQSIENK